MQRIGQQSRRAVCEQLAVGTKKLETVLKKRKEKQEDAMIDFIVETQNKKLDPELIMKNVKELFEDRLTENDTWREDYDAECTIALQRGQQGGNGSQTKNR
jgi:hypothetical protein